MDRTGDPLSWTDLIDDQEWSVYGHVMTEAQRSGIDFAVGGAFALANYTGELRKTKDIDLYVEPKSRDAMIGVLKRSGLDDYFERLPYDRNWIYRSARGDIIVDIIWKMANNRADVDEGWITRGPQVRARGVCFRVLPPEELLWGKLYVMQKDRCDWPDIFNILHAAGGRLDWEYLTDRLGGDTALLRGVLSAFAWLCPEKAESLPRLPSPGPGEAVGDEAGTDDGCLAARARLLDGRPWFRPSLLTQS
jgi:Uncharacterised nucleotidyltransferase